MRLSLSLTILDNFFRTLFHIVLHAVCSIHTGNCSGNCLRTSLLLSNNCKFILIPISQTLMAFFLLACLDSDPPGCRIVRKKIHMSLYIIEIEE